MIRDFVFNSDRVSPGGSTVIGLENGTYFPVDLVLYLRNSSTRYSSYTIPVGISLPTVATYRLHRSYHIYVRATLVPSKRPLRDLPRLTMLTYHANLQKRTARVTSQFRLTSHTKLSNDIASPLKRIIAAPNDGSLFNNPRATSP